MLEGIRATVTESGTIEVGGADGSLVRIWIDLAVETTLAIARDLASR